MWQYYALVFLSSVGIMTVELVAGRLVAPSVGVSLYTWTSVIGVVLAGMSGGYAAGGWLADRFAPQRLLGVTLLLSGFATIAILPLVRWYSTKCPTRSFLLRWEWCCRPWRSS